MGFGSILERLGPKQDSQNRSQFNLRQKSQGTRRFLYFAPNIFREFTVFYDQRKINRRATGYIYQINDPVEVAQKARQFPSAIAER